MSVVVREYDIDPSTELGNELPPDALTAQAVLGAIAAREVAMIPDQHAPYVGIAIDETENRPPRLQQLSEPSAFSYDGVSGELLPKGGKVPLHLVVISEEALTECPDLTMRAAVFEPASHGVDDLVLRAVVCKRGGMYEPTEDGSFVPLQPEAAKAFVHALQNAQAA